MKKIEYLKEIEKLILSKDFKGAEILALEPKSCIVFEDSQAGIQAAINAGMFSVGVGQEDLESCNFKIENFEGMSPKKLITQLSN